MKSESDMERLGRDLLHGCQPPPMPPGLRDRSLDAARREYHRTTESWIDPWVDTIFRSRLLWGAWAVAALLAIFAHPEPTRSPTDLPPTDSSPVVVYPLVDPLGDPLVEHRWTPEPRHRPQPNGPTLAETITPSWRLP